MRSTVSTRNLTINGHSPIPIRRQLTEQLRHAIEAGGVPRDQALPSIRELAGFLGVNPNTVARVIDDLKRSGYVEARRGKGVFVAPAPPARPSPHLRETFLQDTVIRAAALGMTAEDLSVGVLSLAGVRPAAIRGATEVLLVECSPPELDFFARQLEAHLPVRVDKMLLAELVTAHNLEHSIANANLPNISLVGVCPAEGAALGRLVRRADVIVCSTAASERVRGLAGSTVQVLIDDRALDPRAIEMLATLLVQQNGDRPTAAPAPRRLSDGRKSREGATRATVPGRSDARDL